MPAFAFNVYPKGFGKPIQLQDAYSVGQDIVEQFRIRIRQFPEFQYLRGQVEGFSILLYSSSRVKIEIESSISSLKKEDFGKILKDHKRSGRIRYWRPCEPDIGISEIGPFLQYRVMWFLPQKSI